MLKIIQTKCKRIRKAKQKLKNKKSQKIDHLDKIKELIVFDIENR